MRAAAGVALVASLFSPASDAVTNGRDAADLSTANEAGQRAMLTHRADELSGPEADRIASNDNRTPAGTFKNGVLELTLEVRTGMWFPESEKGASVPIQAFAEAGKASSTPGPLIRVPEGTEIRLTLRNTLSDSAVLVFGLHTRPSASPDEGVLVPANGSRRLQFAAGAPGTYYYWGTTTHNGIRDRMEVESQLSGAFVVDPRSQRARLDDRIFVIGVWIEPPSTVNGVEKLPREVLVINGKSWPHTERFTFTE
ncbi:MAG: multicopper oxidase domain-containing protein, partial [Gemmatimonadaceae bacterium]